METTCPKCHMAIEEKGNSSRCGCSPTSKDTEEFEAVAAIMDAFVVLQRIHPTLTKIDVTEDGENIQVFCHVEEDVLSSRLN